MKTFEILVDTTSDLDEKFLAEYDIKMIPGHIAVDGVDTISFVNWNTISREEFYSSLKANPDKYKTSPPSVGEMVRKMEQIISTGMGLLYVALSSGISGAYNFSLQAKDIVRKKYPNAKIRLIDSLRFGPAIGLMAVNASIMRSEGRSVDEVADFLDANKNRYHQAGWLDDLSFVAKQGRLTNSKAFFGTLVGIKPIGEFDYNGLTTVLGKAKGEKNAYETLLAYIKETIVNPEEQIIFIAQSNRLKQAEKYKAMIEDTFHPKAVFVKDVYPSCGTNVGPGLMAAYYIGKEISSDLSYERDIIKKYTGR